MGGGGGGGELSPPGGFPPFVGALGKGGGGGERNSVPLDGSPGRRDKQRDPVVVLTGSLRNINQFTVTRLKRQPTAGDIRQ